LSLPAFAGGHAVVMLSKLIDTVPDRRSGSNGPLPLYGMCCIETPAMVLKRSPEMCWEVPLPAEPKLYLLGFAFSSAQ